MNRKSIFYHFGAICGLVGKESAEIKANPDTPRAKRAQRHINHLTGKWESVLKSPLTPGEKHALKLGLAQGRKEREELA